MIVERAFQRLGAERRRDRILDVGCGAGASTRAVVPWARTIVGVDPEIQMVRNARTVGGGPSYAVGTAEAMPIVSHAVDVLTAAGALNFVDLGRFRAEAARVLRSDGVIVVYDFATGRRCADAGHGERATDIRHWCHDRFSPVFIEPGVIEFTAWYAIVTPTA